MEIKYGAKYDENLDVAVIAKLIRKEIKTAVNSGALPPFAASVRVSRSSMSQSICVNVTAAGFVIHSDALFAHLAAHDGSPWCQCRYSESAMAVLNGIEAMLAAYNYDGSDSMADYFNVNFYTSVGFDCRLTDAELAPILEPAPESAPESATELAIEEHEVLEPATDEIFANEGVDEETADAIAQLDLADEGCFADEGVDEDPEDAYTRSVRLAESLRPGASQAAPILTVVPAPEPELEPTTAIQPISEPAHGTAAQASFASADLIAYITRRHHEGRTRLATFTRELSEHPAAAMAFGDDVHLAAQWVSGQVTSDVLRALGHGATMSEIHETLLRDLVREATSQSASGMRSLALDAEQQVRSQLLDAIAQAQRRAEAAV